MTAPIAVDAFTGAPLLPPTDNEHRQDGSFHAFCCLSADLRAKVPEYRELASQIIITYPKEQE